ncbi:MAG: adenosylcobinamide-GDP ribazoletransferase [Chloroflexota bacterium]|nr:adenosylcobinamide-GDP ribazoletransferase [Chloroflexota bacterium]
MPLLAALQFLTLIPPIIKRPFTAKELGQAVGYYPLVGLLIGAMLAGANYGLILIAPASLTAALVLTLWIVASGALHLDGFLDTWDGLFGGFTPERRLEIMHDERVGAFGFASGFLLMLLKFNALSGLPQATTALILIPTLSRWGVSLALFSFPYARSKGLGRDLKDNVTWRQMALASVIAIIAAWLCAQWLGLIALTLTALIVWGAASFILSRISGLTGDIYGALNELVEMILLIGFAINNAIQP